MSLARGSRAPWPRAIQVRSGPAVHLGAIVLIACWLNQGVSSFFMIMPGRRSGSVARAASPDELQALKVDDLKQRLRAQGLKVSGKKEELISRLLEAARDDTESVDEAASEPQPDPKSSVKSATEVSAKPAKGKSIPVISGDIVFFFTRKGTYIDVEEHRDDLRARGREKGKREAFLLKKANGGAVSSGDIITLKCHLGVYVDFLGSAVRARFPEAGEWQQIKITKEGGSGPIRTGDVVFLHGHQGNVLDVEKEDVKCRWPDELDWQRLIIEK
eukprot:TRINITY_DN109796_c0_g1_i1.p1 TRINITY_DN109796_c0_g1~~TRINITY_DN109796_c0_g1_i1.p1  ORF type:complete len:273 (+),score=53.50 TRINITY_DN109796_c0_g1_i1:24-842(+)